MRHRMRGSPLRSALILAAATFALAAGCSRAPSGLVIGAACPLTGDQAKIGHDMLQGIQLAVDEANAAGGLLGQKVSVYALDDQHNPSQAVAAAHRFVSSKAVVAVIGHLNSACTLPSSDVYAKAGLVQVTPCSTNVDITRRGIKTLYRVCANDAAQGSAAASWATRKLRARKIFVLDDKSTYGQGLADEFTRAAKKLRARIAGRDSINQGEKDFAALLIKVRAAKPDLIFFGGMYPEGSLLAKQARELGMKTTLMGGDGLYDKTLIQLAGEASAEGTFATMVGLDTAALPNGKAFIEAYEKKYGPVAPYAPYGYDAARIVMAAITRAGAPDRAKVAAEVRRTKNAKGVTGVTNFDARGDTLNQVISVYAVRKGTWAWQGSLNPAAR